MRPWVCAVSLSLAACSVLTPFDGLTGGTADGGIDAASDGAGTVDANGATGKDGSAVDAPFDATSELDAASDATNDGDAGATCGFPGPTQGLLAYYPFEEQTGSAVHDCSPNHFDGTFVEGPSATNWTSSGVKGGALHVSAAGGCVDLGMPSQLQPPSLTVAAWINIASYPTGASSGYIVGQTLNAGTNGWRLGTRSLDGGAIGWEHTTGGTNYSFDIPGTPLGAWHHVAVTFQTADTLQIFLDGALVQTHAGLPAIMFTAVSIRIGCRADGTNLLDGNLDEVRIYDHVLTNGEIATLAMP